MGPRGKAWKEERIKRQEGGKKKDCAARPTLAIKRGRGGGKNQKLKTKNGLEGEKNDPSLNARGTDEEESLKSALLLDR